MKYIAVAIALIIASVMTIPAQFTQPDPESIATNILIGQVYPSGNAYLKHFENSKAGWPRNVLLMALMNQSAQSRLTPVEAALSRTTIPPDYIPGVEGLDDEHRACGTAAPKKKDPSVQYQSEDFFDAAFDHCGPNDGVAMYRSSASPYSVKVVAFPPEFALTSGRTVTGRRPVTSAEKQEIAKQKQEMERTGPCTTTPVFVDSAVRLMEANAGDGLTVRLSSYKNPGCFGHLATIYILDILHGKDLIRTFKTSQSHGPL
jgi:hypothetical protein